MNTVIKIICISSIAFTSYASNAEESENSTQFGIGTGALYSGLGANFVLYLKMI